MAAKRKHGALHVQEEEEPVDPSDELLFLALGGGQEVGRSCHILQYKGKTVMLDAGLHAGREGLSALPFYDEFDLSEVDILLISHFHVDHAASLPYVLSKTNFRGRIFMTHSTKAIYKYLISDSVRVGNTASSAENRTTVYTEQDHLTTFPMIEAIDYHTTHTINSIRVTPYPAGHVLGAAMYLIEIAGLKILFTGDYSREDDRHLISAEIPKGIKIDVLITESTFGMSAHVPRQEREVALMKSITSILNRGGRVLMPVFALGRAQELLLILDEYWARHPEYQRYPIYYASSLARKCMVVYQTYIGSMNDNVKRMFRERMAEAEAAGSTASSAGPWDFRFVRALKGLDRFDDVGGCVMLASPGMLQSGVSRELLERWAPDEKNGVIITGYSVEGTVARMILREDFTELKSTSKSGAAGRRQPGREEQEVTIPIRCRKEEHSFAAHVDGQENVAFIEEINAPVVVLVHGEKSNMTRVRSRLLSDNQIKNRRTKVFAPANCEELRIPIRMDKTAKVVGKLAERIKPPAPLPAIDENDEEAASKRAKEEEAHASQIIRNAVLVQNDLKLSLMAPEDLREYAGLTTTTITCKQRITLASASVELIRWALEGTFGGIRDLTQKAPPKSAAENGEAKTEAENEEESSSPYNHPEETVFRILDLVTVRLAPKGLTTVEWEGNALNDGIADSVLACLMAVESAPASVQRSSQVCGHGHSHAHEAHTNGNGDTKPLPDDSTTAEEKASEEAGEENKATAILKSLTFATPNPKNVNKNPFANLSTAEQLSRLFLLLEAQFGSESIEPVAQVRPSSSSPLALPAADTNGTSTKQEQDQEQERELKTENESPPTDPQEAETKAKEEPSPALIITTLGGTATLWLDDMTVDSRCAPLKARILAVVGRGLDCILPLAAPTDEDLDLDGMMDMVGVEN